MGTMISVTVMLFLDRVVDLLTSLNCPVLALSINLLTVVIWIATSHKIKTGV